MWKSLGVWLLQAVIEHVVTQREQKQAQIQDPAIQAAIETAVKAALAAQGK